MDHATITRSKLCDYMDDHMFKLKFRGHLQEFLPKSAFDQATAQPIIQKIIQEEEDLYLTAQEKDDLISKIYREGRKIFATCIYCDLPMACIRVLFSNGLTDARFPFTLEDCPEMKEKRKFRTGFLVNQKRFNVPYFDENTILNLNDDFSMPVDFDEGSSNLRGKGAFGEVWEVGIHPDHRSFAKGPNDGKRYAMKVIQHEGSIQREQKWMQAMAGLAHANLVKCLTSWTFDRKLYMIYELAECNLEEFMQRRKSADTASGLTDTMFLKQLCGLARALKVIHQQEGEPDGNMDTDKFLKPQEAATKSGYIHDFKPENILVFTVHDRVRSLRISDFSCAKVVDFVATVSGNNRRSYMTMSKSGTPIYRAPESVNNGPTSRPYDLWSFGCVYLELLVWFLDGYKALEDFRADRYGPNGSKGMEDEGFYALAGEGSHAKMQLREPVVKKINELSSRCEGGLKEIADIIPSLLEIDPKQRLTATELVKRLRHLDTGADLESDIEQATSLTVPSMSSSQLPAYESDSDFEGLIKVIRPTE